jgi:hypothetical protein
VRQLGAGCRAKYDYAAPQGVVEGKDLRLSVNDEGDPTEPMAVEQLQALGLRKFLEFRRGLALIDRAPSRDSAAPKLGPSRLQPRLGFPANQPCVSSE